MFWRLLLVLLVTCFTGDLVCAQPFVFASGKTRDSITLSLKQTIHNTVDKPFSPANGQEWKGACWAMELLLYCPKKLHKKIPGMIAALKEQPVSMQQVFLEWLITLWPGKFRRPLLAVWQQLGSPKVKAMALEQLALAETFPVITETDLFRQSDYYTHYYRRWREAPPACPEKDQLLDTGFLKGQTVLVSFQYRNRDRPGCLMIRTADHRWEKDIQGQASCFTQLARSITNMPWYLTNGNTPQGLYKINGTDISTNNWIGPTPNLQTVMPFEEAVPAFYRDTTGSLSQYRSLLGPLSNYEGLYETYYAGKAGRSEIIAHGTAIPEWYYRNKPYHPCTPSLGCLCSPEIWDASGILVKSTQQEWMQAVQKKSPVPQYLLVVDIRE